LRGVGRVFPSGGNLPEGADSIQKKHVFGPLDLGE
jgi:hypothetical protein